MTTMLQDGQLTTKAADEILVYRFDWSELPTSATIVTSTCEVTAAYLPAMTALTVDNVTRHDRETLVRIGGGRPGVLYRITNTVVTNEAPDQTYLATFELLIES